MQKRVLFTILLLLVSVVSAQEITGYIGLNVITPAQSVDATARLTVKNESAPVVPEIAINRTPENLTPIQELPVAPHVPETVFTLISKFFSWFRLR